MSDTRKKTWFTNRQFVAAIRAELDQAGHSDIAISRQWIEDDVPGYGYLVHVPVGAALTVPLTVVKDFFQAVNMDDLRWHARAFAAALVYLKCAEKLLEKYARDVRDAAVAEIAVARSKGLDILLDNVGFRPICANALIDED